MAFERLTQWFGGRKKTLKKWFDWVKPSRLVSQGRLPVTSQPELKIPSVADFLNQPKDRQLLAMNAFLQLPAGQEHQSAGLFFGILREKAGVDLAIQQLAGDGLRGLAFSLLRSKKENIEAEYRKFPSDKLTPAIQMEFRKKLVFWERLTLADNAFFGLPAEKKGILLYAIANEKIGAAYVPIDNASQRKYLEFLQKTEKSAQGFAVSALALMNKF